MKTVIKIASGIVFVIAIVCAEFTQVFAFSFFWDNEPEEAQVPVIMYHLVTKNGRLQGKFAISPDELESDLKYLKENGYETVVVSDLIRFVERGANMPEKPVMLTFDDGCSSDYYYVFPLLEKYDAKAVMSIVGKLTDDYSTDGKSGKKPHLVWNQVKEMYKSKRVEFQNHSYNMHGGGGSGRKSGESGEAYAKRFAKDLEKAQMSFEENIKYQPSAFTYPLGIIGKGSTEVLKETGFKAALTCAEGVNILKSEETDTLFRLKRNIRRSGKGIEGILKKLEAGTSGKK